jgi:beta-lactamase regulating signal transducer with metallopeptidase domain
MAGSAAWLGSLVLIAFGVFGLGVVIDAVLRRRSAATRRGIWALVIVVALVLPVTRLAIDPPALVGLTSGLAGVLLVIWASGAMALLARLAHGWVVARRWVEGSDAVESLAWLENLAVLRGATRVELRRSATIETPCSVGVLRPVILVPDSMLEIPADERHSLLAHELAHVARADCFMLILGGVVRALYWIDPLAWLALRRLREQAESAADDAVLSAGVTSSSYAAQLVGLARQVTAAGLRERVTAILDGERTRSGSLACVPRWSAARLVGLAVLLATMTTAACEARTAEPGTPLSKPPSEAACRITPR